MLELTRRLLAAADGGEPVVLASVIEPGSSGLRPGSRLLIEPSGTKVGSLGDAALDALVAAYAPGVLARHAAETVYPAAGGLTTRETPGAAAIYIEAVEAKPVFLVVGAGHIGRALAKLANMLDFHVAVIDDREEYADPVLIPEAGEVICDEFETAIDRYPIGQNTVVRRRTATVLRHLQEEGFDPGELARVRTPIGLYIGAETPEEIAVSIVAEVIMVRHGGTGTPMYHRPAGLRGASATAS
ncbi:MAG: hypothetical protein DYG91_06660 [Chloroflexi bacterium CFX7]|nr:hypothetical protein [Chloroflexi bacterium CFX7]